MTHQNNKIPRLSLSLYSTFEPIEVIRGESKNWMSRLPFCGALEGEPPETEREEWKIITVKPRTNKLPLPNNNPKTKLRMQKCLRKNQKLSAKITNTLSWITKEAIKMKNDITDKRKFNRSKKLIQSHIAPGHIESPCKLKDTSSSSTTFPFSQGESYMMEPNIVTVQEAIISCASTFDIHTQDPEYFIGCLEEYKTITRKYLRKPSKYEMTFRRFKRDLTLHRSHQKQNETSISKYYGCTYNDWWDKANDYFLCLTPEINTTLQGLLYFATPPSDFLFLDMFAINRLSSLLRALKYCREKDITFDNFKELVSNQRQVYLRSLGKNSNRKYSVTYPNACEFHYLLAVKHEDVADEISILCNRLLGGGNLFVSEEEEALEDLVEKQTRRNTEIGEKMMKRMASKKVLIKEAENKSLIASYGKYMSTLKRKKEEILNDNRCSTEYTDKRIMVLE